MVKRLLIQFLKLLLFWILVFDFQRILFSIHNWGKFSGVSAGEWFGAFYHSLRLDLATAGGLAILPLLFLCLYGITSKKWVRVSFYTVLFMEAVLVALVHSGEVNAYGEWNHKLTSRVFMHLGNPDEVVRTADYSMTIWYIVYATLELIFAWKLMRWFFKLEPVQAAQKWFVRTPVMLLCFAVTGAVSFLLVRGGLQQIPININSAIYTNNPVSNDLSINSLYYFGKSYLLYNRSEIDEFMPKIDPAKAKMLTEKLMDYPRQHDQLFLTDKRPNVVFIVLEGWAAEAIGTLSETKGATPNFDKLAGEGVLFTKVYGTSSTSEIGNSSIFSGFPGVPEVSISMQPEKHRKLRSLNQDLEAWGYGSGYMFSGDLKYGNIGGYFLDHGFDVVKDERDFPSDLPRGKLNFYDADLYKFLLKEINQAKQPFMQCAFTGSTHSPYDQPKTKGQNFTGNEADFMNSVVYADQALGRFMENCKKQPWFKNTLFVLVADHGHSTPSVEVPHNTAFYRIPLLFWGNVIKPEFRGKRMDVVGSQADIPATLLYQMGGNSDAYPWSKDLMNPKVPQFALHTIIRGYGWVTPRGNMTYQMQLKFFGEENFPADVKQQEYENCYAFLTEVYRYYKEL
jgi:phosphoglycerol transferase MdoB-like AlkP superfamily enzyme